MFNNKNIHMIGIGGISMSGIAEILIANNCKVTGFDAKESEITKKLISKGIAVDYSPNYDFIKNADIIIYTAAIKADDPELTYAKSLNKECYERSIVFGLLMKDYKNVLCISGTHGKSTTSGMVGTIFVECNMNPTIQIGANLPLINGNVLIGGKEYFIAEACEYVDSFLDFFPTSEVILNIDDDHLDYFKNIDNIIHSFKRYTQLLPENGHLIINNDDENVKIAANERITKITYGINNNSNYFAKNIAYNEFGYGSYDLYINNEFIQRVKLSVNGKHNIYNSLAAIALSHQYISDINAIINALEKYHGVGRRFEYLGKYKNALVYDDYAHHPTEIATTYQSTKDTPHNESWAIFGPHTYSRTKEHLPDFGKILSKFDHVIIAPIFAAREINIYNITEDDLVKEIKNNGNNNTVFIDTYEKIVDYIKENVKDNDIIITIGAGSTDKIAKELIKE